MSTNETIEGVPLKRIRSMFSRGAVCRFNILQTLLVKFLGQVALSLFKAFQQYCHKVLSALLLFGRSNLKVELGVGVRVR